VQRLITVARNGEDRKLDLIIHLIGRGSNRWPDESKVLFSYLHHRQVLLDLLDFIRLARLELLRLQIFFSIGLCLILRLIFIDERRRLRAQYRILITRLVQRILVELRASVIRGRRERHVFEILDLLIHFHQFGRERPLKFVVAALGLGFSG